MRFIPSSRMEASDALDLLRLGQCPEPYPEYTVYKGK